MHIARSAALTSAQLGLWLKQQIDPGNPGLLTGATCILSGAVDIERLHRAIQAVVDRADALRSCFGTRDGDPVQHVRHGVVAPFDIQDRDAAEIHDWASIPFDIERDVLVASRVVPRDGGTWLWQTRFSHLVADGVSLLNYVRAVADAYRLIGEGRPAELTGLTPFASQLEIDRQYRQSPRCAQDIDHWRAQYLEPAGRIFSLGKEDRAAHRHSVRYMPAQEYAAFRNACLADNVQHSSVLIAIAAAIARLQHGRADVALGVASHNRSAGHRSTIGMFSGYMPFRTRVDASAALLELARDVEGRMRRDLRARLATADQLTRELHTDALFDLAVCLMPDGHAPDFGDVECRHECIHGCDPEGAYLAVFDHADGSPAQFQLSFPPHAIDAAEATAFFAQFMRFVAQWPTLRSIPLRDVRLLDDVSVSLLRSMSRGAQRELPPPADVLAWIDAQSLAHPEMIALVDAAGQFTYAQLRARSFAVAARLHHEEVGAGMVVAIRMERSFDLVAAILGVLRVGGAYLPLDVAIPPERAAYMIENSRCRTIVTAGAADNELAVPLKRVHLDGIDGTAVLPTARASHPDQLAYVLYTSGSTGKPKGVEISRGALANVIASFEHELGAGAPEVMLSTTGISFDIFGLELFLPLCTGGKLVLADRNSLLETGYLPQLAREHSATVFQATPTLLRNLLDSGWTPHDELRILVGGEALSDDLAMRLAGCLELLNVYGPTEATIWASISRVKAGAGTPPPAIGKPLPNTQVHVLDARLELVPVGVAGELYIAGVQLARGYAGRPDLTADRFGPRSIRERAAHVSDRRPRPLACRRGARIPGPGGSASEDSRAPHRARRNRKRAVSAPRGRFSRGDRTR